MSDPPSHWLNNVSADSWLRGDVKFDIRPSGVHGVRAKATGRGDDLTAKGKALRNGADQASKVCGHPDLSGALGGFSDYITGASRPMSVKVASGVVGAGKASDAYEDGDDAMAAQSAAARPSGLGANRLMGGV